MCKRALGCIMSVCGAGVCARARLMSLGHGIRRSSQASVICSVKDFTTNRIWMWKAGNWIFYFFLFGGINALHVCAFKFTYNSRLGDDVVLFVLLCHFFDLAFSQSVIVTNTWHSFFSMEDLGSWMPLVRLRGLTCVSFGVTCRHLSHARQKIASVVTHEAVPRVPCLRPKACFEGTESVLLCWA